MKKLIYSTKMFIAWMMVGCSLVCTACSDDDEPRDSAEVTASTMYGEYKGKMTTTALPLREGDDTPVGVEIEAVVKNDSVLFDNFPVRDIVLSIVGDENVADNIIENIGTISYAIGYTPKIAPDKDAIAMAFKAEPLKLSLNLPAGGEEAEAHTLVVEVAIEAVESGEYKVEAGNLAFAIAAKQVFLGEGEEKTEIPAFTPTQFDFDLNQSKVAHHWSE